MMSRSEAPSGSNMGVAHGKTITIKLPSGGEESEVVLFLDEHQEIISLHCKVPKKSIRGEYNTCRLSQSSHTRNWHGISIEDETTLRETTLRFGTDVMLSLNGIMSCPFNGNKGITNVDRFYRDTRRSQESCLENLYWMYHGFVEYAKSEGFEDPQQYASDMTRKTLKFILDTRKQHMTMLSKALTEYRSKMLQDIIASTSEEERKKALEDYAACYGLDTEEVRDFVSDKCKDIDFDAIKTVGELRPLLEEKLNFFTDGSRFLELFKMIQIEVDMLNGKEINLNQPWIKKRTGLQAIIDYTVINKVLYDESPSPGTISAFKEIIKRGQPNQNAIESHQKQLKKLLESDTSDSRAEKKRIDKVMTLSDEISTLSDKVESISNAFVTILSQDESQEEFVRALEIIKESWFPDPNVTLLLIHPKVLERYPEVLMAIWTKINAFGARDHPVSLDASLAFNKRGITKDDISETVKKKQRHISKEEVETKIIPLINHETLQKNPEKLMEIWIQFKCGTEEADRRVLTKFFGEEIDKDLIKSFLSINRKTLIQGTERDKEKLMDIWREFECGRPNVSQDAEIPLRGFIKGRFTYEGITPRKILKAIDLTALLLLISQKTLQENPRGLMDIWEEFQCGEQDVRKIKQTLHTDLILEKFESEGIKEKHIQRAIAAQKPEVEGEGQAVDRLGEELGDARSGESDKDLIKSFLSINRKTLIQGTERDKEKLMDIWREFECGEEFVSKDTEIPFRDLIVSRFADECITGTKILAAMDLTALLSSISQKTLQENPEELMKIWREFQCGEQDVRKIKQTLHTDLILEKFKSEDIKERHIQRAIAAQKPEVEGEGQSVSRLSETLGDARSGATSRMSIPAEDSAGEGNSLKDWVYLKNEGVDYPDFH